MANPAVKTIVVLMQENRSFDHMLGYLSLPPWNRAEVDGLRADPAWQGQFGNTAAGVTYRPAPLPDPSAVLPGDPVHDRPAIAGQLGAPTGGVFPMNGFVQSCPTLDPATGQPVVMGYFDGTDLPTTHFFAQNYAICDRWFASLPASTQPNRLMLMAGETLIDNNKDLIPSQPLVYDWLRQRNLRWRVYHESLPFFSLMPDWVTQILLDDNFREFNRIFADIQNEADATFPQVIFLEPRFTDAPHLEVPNDDHAPSALSPGQDFLAQAYAAVTSNPARWQGTVLLVMYDEHGGFFDHVSPPTGIDTPPPVGATYAPFTSLGARVPAFVISPLVAPGSVYSGILDHTSVLKFIADTFADGSYSPAVDGRKVRSVSDVLAQLPPAGGVRVDLPVPKAVAVGFGPDAVPTSADANLTPMGFSNALDNLRAHDTGGTRRKFPKLVKRF
jgi:phospholipase C